MWNKLQPKRQVSGLAPRTHISHPDSIYNVYQIKNMVAQVILYNWCSGVDYVNGVAIADLHAHLFQDTSVTMRQMGMTILQAVQYDPRKLKAKTLDNDKACKIYVFDDPLDLKYGLEWMISMWIWNLEWEQDEIMAEPPEDRQEIMLEIFDEIGSCESDTLFEKYVEPMQAEGDASGFYEINPYLKRPDWPTLWAKFGWKTEPMAMTAPRARTGELRSRL